MDRKKSDAVISLPTGLVRFGFFEYDSGSSGTIRICTSRANESIRIRIINFRKTSNDLLKLGRTHCVLKSEEPAEK